MRQRLLLSLGVSAVAGALLIGSLGMSNTALGFSMMDGLNGSSGTPISMDRAQQSVQSFIDRTGNKDLKIDELMQFDRNFYALVKERSTGVGAFELLVNRRSGSVSFEPGPNMMWNTKYSIMGRMGMTGGAWMSGSSMGGFGFIGGSMGGSGTHASGTPGSGMGSGTTGSGMGSSGPTGVGSDGAMTVTSDRATQIAQAWLDRQGGGNSAGTADAFHGYYTFHFEKGGQIAGMLSVNGSSGQVWFHTWHGNFVQVRDLAA